MFFDRFVVVDWSASNRPKTGKDSVWVCSLGPGGSAATANPPTRGSAESYVRGLLTEAVSDGERALVGFDFPYSYPSGLAPALGLGDPSWLSIWRFLESRLLDDPQTNRSNRFDVGAEMNARLSDPVFWGCPPSRRSANLSSRRDLVRYRIEGQSSGLSEWRESEEVLRGRGFRPHSTWQLLGAGSVGSQALTGIPVVSRLRRDPELADVSSVWPFELGVPDLPEGQSAVVHAEVWPSLIKVPPVPGEVRDETQVVCLAHELRALDRSGDLARLFAASTPAAAEEGWILGVA